MAQPKIDLTQLTSDGKVRVLSGHEKGVAARKHFELDALDAENVRVTVKVPDYVYAISSSFVQGMFAESLARAGSVDNFFARYEFDARAAVIQQIERGLAH